MPDSPGADTPTARDLPRWARAVDVAAVILLVLAAFMAIHGGFVLHPAGIRLSVRSVWRVLSWSAALVVARHLIIRQPPLHRWMGAAILDGARGPLPDDAVVVGRPRSREPGSRPLARSFLYATAVLVLYSILTALMTYPQVRQMDGVSVDVHDPLLSTWRLAWFAHQLPRDPLHLFDANIFHPERNTLAYSDAMLVPSLMVAPLVWLGVHQLIAYNLLLLAGFALSGATMFLLVRSLTHRVEAALVAGFIFAFLPYRFMHYAHLELQMAQWMPLCLWALHRTIAAGRLRDGLLTGLFLALQTLSSWYYGIFFATYLVPVGAALLVAAGREKTLRAVRPLAAGGLLAAILVLPFARPYFVVRKSVGERPVSEIKFYSATPQNYLAAHPRNTLLGSVTAGLGAQERELFQGIAVPAIAVIGLWPPLSAARIGYGLGLVLAFEISLGFNGALYPWLHEYVLPYRGLRAPARMAIVVGLSLAILAGYGVARICARLRGRRSVVAAVAIVGALIVVEYHATLTLDSVSRTPPEVYRALPSEPTPVVLELPLIVPDIALEPYYMYFSTFDWHKLINGYSGFCPPSYVDLLQQINAFPDDSTLDELRRRGTDFIIVHGAFLHPEAYGRLIGRMDRRADLAFRGKFRWRSRETRLYRVLPSENPR